MPYGLPTPPSSVTRYRPSSNSTAQQLARVARNAIISANRAGQFGMAAYNTYQRGRAVYKNLFPKKVNKARAEARQEEDETQINPGSVWTDSFVSLKMAGKKQQTKPKGKKDLGGWIYNKQVAEMLNSGGGLGVSEYTSFVPIMIAGQLFATTGYTSVVNLNEASWSQSIWGLDPDSSITGTPALGQGGVGIGAVTVGNTSSTSALSGATFLQKIVGEFIFTNFAPGACEFHLYWLTPKVLTNDAPEITLDKAANYNRMGASTGIAHTTATEGAPGMADVTPTVATAPRRNVYQLGYGMSPFMFKTFNDTWKVLKKSDHILQSANSKKIKFKISYGRHLDYQKMWAKSGNDDTSPGALINNYIPGYSVVPFIVIQGPPVYETATAFPTGKQMTIGPADLRMCGYYNVIGRHVPLTTDKIPTTVRTDSQILAGGGAVTIAAVGAAPTAYALPAP